MPQNVNYRAVARRAARRYGLDPHIFVRQINAESSFNPNASSGVAFGIAQFTPDTARSVGVNPYHPRQALDAAAKLMAGYVHKYGSYRNALVAYNAGPGRVGGPLPGETQRYIAQILGGSNPTQLNRPQSGGPVARPGRNGSFNVTTTSGGAQGLDVPGVDTAALAALLSQPAQAQQPQATYIAPPSVTSGSYLPGTGLSLPATQQPAVSDNGLAAKLAAIGSLSPDSSLSSSPQKTSTTTTVRGMPSAAGPAGPVAKGFHLGSPVPGQRRHGATHPTAGLPGYPAYDYMAPAGSAALAPVTGRVVKLSGHDPAAGPTDGPHGPFGWSVYIKGNDGRTYYLTHMGARNVRVGQIVRAGQRIGAVGNYAKYGGANHIHMGVHG